MSTESIKATVREIVGGTDYSNLAAFLAFVEEGFPMSLIKEFYRTNRIKSTFVALGKRLRAEFNKLKSVKEKMDFAREVHRRIPFLCDILHRIRQSDRSKI